MVRDARVVFARRAKGLAHTRVLFLPAGKPRVSQTAAIVDDLMVLFTRGFTVVHTYIQARCSGSRPNLRSAYSDRGPRGAPR